MADLTIPKDAPQVVRDMWKAILEDSWMNIVVWGQPRVGKTTVQMQLAYSVYKDWNHVLQSFVYNLAGILYNIDHGVPTRIRTLNGLHNRLPLVMPDDWGAHGNKAKTMGEPAMNIFKGAIDTYGTQMAILLSSMGNPDSITLQLQGKYTHEIYVPAKGEAKYDVIEWQQNFMGWQPRRRKAWCDNFTFESVPLDVYKEYDEKRLDLVDELNQLIRDSMIDNESTKLIRRMDDKDAKLLKLLQDKGMVAKDWFHKEENKGMLETLKKCKARSLVIPVVKPGTSNSYYYDVTDFGLGVLKLYENPPKQ
jgi:hypothetical protein